MQAKFTLFEKTECIGGTFRVTFRAASGPGNETWSKYTPNGVIEMSITNPAAVEGLTPGKSYLLEFTPVDS